jgi:L-fuculose-phosphate aldolase
MLRLDDPHITELIHQLQSTGRAMLENELTLGNAGNLSASIDEKYYLISASGTHLGELTADDFVICSTDNTDMIGKLKPSKETPMHSAIYKNRPEIKAVLHASPFYSTMIACSSLSIPANWFVEDMYYLERVSKIDYFHPGSKALGHAVEAKAYESNIILMKNHGVLVYDTSIKEALMAMLTLEMVCKMMIVSKQAGIELDPLSNETVQDFLENSSYRKRRQWKH